jgi:hypothetical protein
VSEDNRLVVLPEGFEVSTNPLLGVACVIYAARVTGSAANRPTGLARQCVTEAKELIAEVDRQTTGEATEADDLTEDQLAYLRCLVRLGKIDVSGESGGEHRRVLTKRGLASYVGDSTYAPTDKGKALVGEGDPPPFPLPEGFKYSAGHGRWFVTVSRGYGVETGTGGTGTPTREEWDEAVERLTAGEGQREQT